MAYILPVGTDTLLSQDHAFLHRVFCVDAGAPEQSLGIDASGNAVIASGKKFKIGTNNLAHSDLDGLTTGDPHTQYALLAGRTGNQAFYGSTDASGTLTLLSTAHATKGKIVFGTTSVYDEANKYWGFGTTTPNSGISANSVAKVHIQKSATEATASGSVLMIDTPSTYFGFISFQSGATRNGFIGKDYNDTVASAHSIVFVAETGGEHFYVGGAYPMLFSTNGSERMRILSGGNVGILTATPSYSLAFGGNAARTIGLERHTTADTAGNDLTLLAGGATSGATNKNGGNLYLSSGISTGIGTSNIYFQTATASVNTPSTKMTILGNGDVGIGVSPTAVLHLKAGTATAGTAPLKIDVGTNLTTALGGEIEHSGTTTTSFYYISPFVASTATRQTIATDTNILTLTNKRNKPRIYSTTSIAGTPGTLTPEIDTYDYFEITAQAAALNIANKSTSTPTGGEKMIIAITSDATPRALTYGTDYVAKGGVALPSTTVASKTTTLGFVWNAGLGKWNLLAVGVEA